MTTEAEFVDAVRVEPNPVRRLVIAAGLIATAASQAGVQPLVLSGGTAVALLTHAAFATADIDFITPRGDDLGVVLERLGFVRRHPHAHVWLSRDTGITVDSPASALPAHSATDTIIAPDGSPIAVWSVTDLIVDRVAQAAGQGGKERLMQALALRALCGGNFDAVRARQRAADDLISGELDAFVRVAAAFEHGGLSAEEAAEMFRHGGAP